MRGVCFPAGNVVVGGPGADFLYAPSDLVEHGGAYVAGFEEREVIPATTGSCPDLE